MIEGVQLKCVECFTYLGSTVSTDGLLHSEFSSRIHKASETLERLKVKVLHQKGIRLSAKLKVYRAVLVSTLIYGETWTYHWHIKQLKQFYTRTLHMIMGIPWQDRVTNQEILDRAGSTSIESMLQKAQLRWTGHVIRLTVTQC